MKKSSLLILIGVLIAALGVAIERIFGVPLPPYVVIPSGLVGIACLLAGYAMSRTALANSRPIEPTRGRYYLVLFLAVAIGVIVGFFGYRRIYSDGPLWIPLASGVIAFVLGATYFYWDVFLRQRSNS